MIEGITSAPELGKPDYELALKQHDAYIEALKSCGVEVTVLPADEAFPDSCFVEDPAVLTRKCAIITNPGAETRNLETKAMIPVIKQFYPDDLIEYIKAPGTLEGGDVMMVGDHFYIGRSNRTNEEGIRQFIEILNRHGLTGSEVPLKEGDTALSILQRGASEKGLSVGLNGTGFTAYVSSVGSLKEFDKGPESGWLFKVNGKIPSEGCATAKVKDHDMVAWFYIKSYAEIKFE
jgi:hypothetical protein